MTMISGPPTMWSALADQPGVSPTSFATVRAAVSGAARLAPEVAEAVAKRLGLELPRATA